MMHNHHTPENPAQTEGRMIRWASRYDILTNVITLGQVGRLYRLTAEQALLQAGESMLDVGCGTGGVTIPAKRLVGVNGMAAGIDPAPEMIAVAKKKAQRKGMEIDFRIGVIEDLPFADNSFEAVTASLMMHHLPTELQDKGLAEIYRVLKPGGRLLIADMAGERSQGGRREYNPMGALHRGKSFSIKDLAGALPAAGFREITWLQQRFFIIGFVRAIK